MNRPRIRSNRELVAWASLLVLPVCTVLAATAARTTGGPSWLWFNLDPDYFYLLDAVNVVNLTTPGHVYHPGTTVDWLGALILKATYPFSGGEAIAAAVLADPERHLRLIGNAFVVFAGFGALAVGAASWRAFGALSPAWMLQMAPLLSMVIVKQGHHVKPEALLVTATLLLIALSVATLEPGRLEHHRRQFAVAFGAIAGFAVATKITALPVFVLPLFVLADAPGAWRAMALYGAAAFVSLVVFTLPAIGAYDVFFAWMAKVSLGAGAYGGDAPGVVAWTTYPKSIAKLLARPAFHVPLALALVTLAWAAVRRRRGRPLPASEVRLLAGTVVAQLAQVLVVAKQPNAIYMIPALMLSALAFVVAWRLWAAVMAERGRAALDRGIAVLLAALVAAQGFAVVKLTRSLADERARALAADDARFARCARVYSYAASSPAFALLLGDYVTGSRFAGRLAEQGPANVYWLDHWWDQSRVVLRDWRGPADLAQVLATAPCTMFRGSQWWVTEPLLKKLAPGLTFDAACSTRDETIVTRGVGCDGRPLR
ncbi:MAG: hypothetical protein HYZ04_01425 [Rhodospirillales bacterium]|nr:hypothetical protein [Rhodospirillales bacterium]